MTTTGAAKFRDLISGVRSSIMVIEEAAEITEAHVSTSLNKNVQQLVLIGDHQ